MKLKLIALFCLAAGLMLSSCSDDEVPAKKSPFKNNSQTEENKNPNSGNTDSEEESVNEDLSDYVAQEAFALEDVALSKVTYNLSRTYQKVQGFGAMLTPKGWAPSPSTGQIDDFYKEYGLNILRLYIYGDKNQWGSDINVIRQAVNDGAIILACPWQVPSEMAEKITEIVWNDGQREQVNQKVDHLKHDCWEGYADHLIEYVGYMKKQGVPIYAISVQNEPDAEFTYWTPREIREFTEEWGDYIKEETGVKLCTPEACGMREDYTNEILNNKDAYNATDIIAGHLYQGFSNIDNVHSTNGYVKNRYNYINSIWDKIKADNKEWWMTEHLFNEGEKSSNPSDWKFLTWDYCLNHLGLEIHDCMKASCSAYIYWYLKRFYGLIYDSDKEGRSGDNAEDTYAHNAFIMAQWGKYATGKTRIEASCSDTDIKLTAYKSPSGKQLSFVAINFSDDEKYLSIDVDADKFEAYGLTCDKKSQAKQKLTKIIPNKFDKKVVLAIPAMGIGSVTVVQ